MFTALVNVEALASRAVSRPRPARGRTTSRALNRSLARSFQTTSRVLSLTPITTVHESSSDVLGDITGNTRGRPVNNRAFLLNNGSISSVVPPRDASESALGGQGLRDRAKALDLKDSRASIPSGYPQTRGLVEALEEGDARKIHTYLSYLISASDPGDAMRGTVARLPQTTFSELLRCLDPFVISKELDAAQGIPIGAGVAQFSSLGELVNKYGLRVLYVRLLRCLMVIRNMRREAGHQLLLSDYVILLRCAGAACDLTAAKKFREEIETHGYKDWWQGDVYNEFCKARFLTEPLYAQHNLAQFRVRPRNLHRTKLMLPAASLLKLDVMRAAMMRRQVHRFGQNPGEPEYAEHITRTLRKTKPIARAIRQMESVGATPDEKLLCTFMIAHGRAGSVRLIWGMLERYWGVIVRKDSKTGEVEINGGRAFPPDSPLRPTTRLLDAIVHSLCCSGEVSVALKLVDFVSTRYQLRIPDRTWSDLLEWTYVLASKNVAREWKLANFPQKAMTGNAVRLVWDTMVNEPYNYKPGLKDYNILVKVLIGQNRLLQAMELMRELRYLYNDALRENEEALFELIQTMDQRVEPASAMHRYRTAQSQKLYMWHCFSLWCKTLLKRVRSNRLDDEMVTRLLPRFVDEFRPFMPKFISYRTATGYVDIRSGSSLRRYKEERQTFHVPAQGFRVPHGADESGHLSAIPWIAQYRSQLARGPETRTVRVRRPKTGVPNLLGPAGDLPAEWLEREFA